MRGPAGDATEALLGDLVVLTSMPALWIDRSADRIVSDALTLLRRMREIDVACAEYADAAGRTRQVVASSAAVGGEAVAAQAVLARLPLMRARPGEVHAFSLDGRELRVLIAPLSVVGEVGTLAVGSHRPDFPSRADRIVIDVTANQTAIALRSASLLERLREADQRKDEFLATLAHELRNPLGAISSASQFLMRDESEPRRIEMLEVVSRQVGHLAHMVDGLLDMSRLTRGVATLDRKHLDLRDAVERAVGSMRIGHRLDRHSVEVIPWSAALVIDADEARVEQVVTNLLDNAVKYTPAGGRIEIAVRQHGDNAEVVIRDDGIGISDAFLPHVFELFAQAPRPLDRASGGLGIGLAVVREVAHLHGGWVRADSEGAGHGSAFTVSLPLARGEGMRAASSGFVGSAPTPRRIVLVEDGPDARMALQQLLELDGHNVTVAADGESGLALIVEMMPDVALIDVGLPGIDGYAVARAVRAEPSCAGVALIALTGYGQPSDRDHALGAGFDSHLVKPVDHRTLARVLADPPRRSAR
jgi:signal transduction histidine kinase